MYSGQVADEGGTRDVTATDPGRSCARGGRLSERLRGRGL